MKFEKVVTLKKNDVCVIKSPDLQDARKVLEHMVMAADETPFMARHSDEITMTIEQEELYLQNMIENPRAVMIAAYVGDDIVGVAGVHPVANVEKYRHRCEYGISVLKSYWGRGIGYALTQCILEAAKSMGYEQIELEVVDENRTAVALYEKCGFVRYGSRPYSFKERDGHYTTLDLMFRRL